MDTASEIINYEVGVEGSNLVEFLRWKGYKIDGAGTINMDAETLGVVDGKSIKPYFNGKAYQRRLARGLAELTRQFAIYSHDEALLN